MADSTPAPNLLPKSQISGEIAFVTAHRTDTTIAMHPAERPRRLRVLAGGAVATGLCAVLLVSLHALPAPHGFITTLERDARRGWPAQRGWPARSAGAQLLLEPLLGSGTGARRPRAWRPVTQLGAMRVQPRSWVAVTVPPKETRFGSTAELLPPPPADPYAAFDAVDAEDDENPHHITFRDVMGVGATGTWVRGAEAGADDFEDDDDDNAEQYRTTVTVSPKDARVGAYVRYTMGGPPDAAQSDAARAEQEAARAREAEEAELDAEPLLRPPKIKCSNANPLGLKPPPCEIAPAEHKDGVFEEDDDVYD